MRKTAVTSKAPPKPQPPPKPQQPARVNSNRINIRPPPKHASNGYREEDRYKYLAKLQKAQDALREAQARLNSQVHRLAGEPLLAAEHRQALHNALATRSMSNAARRQSDALRGEWRAWPVHVQPDGRVSFTPNITKAMRNLTARFDARNSKVFGGVSGGRGPKVYGVPRGVRAAAAAATNGNKAGTHGLEGLLARRNRGERLNSSDAKYLNALMTHAFNNQMAPAHNNNTSGRKKKRTPPTIGQLARRGWLPSV